MAKPRKIEKKCSSGEKINLNQIERDCKDVGVVEKLHE